MKRKLILTGSIIAALVLALAVGLTWAQGPEPPGESVQPQDVGIAAYITPTMSYQGRLLENGVPVNGNRSMTFRLYNAAAGGTLLWTEGPKTVAVSNGLFNVILGDTTSLPVDSLDQALWLEIEVAGTRLPRQKLHGAPYALSLVPGADVTGNIGAGWSVLYARNEGSGRGLTGYSASGEGVYGSSPNGYGGYFVSDNNVALKAAGTGIIQSTAVSRIFVPGTEAVPHSDSRNDLEFRYYGRGLVEVRKTSAGSGVEKILIPVAIPAVLYGQPVRVYDLRVHYGVSSATSAITATYLYRQSVTPSSPTWWPGFSTVITNTVPQTSTNFTYYHMYCTAPECRLGADDSILTLELDLYFASNTHAFAIGGVRLTLEHD